MYQGTYKIADKIIEIESFYEDVQKLCLPYKYDGQPDMHISMCEKDIACERQKGSEEENINLFSDGYLETLAVYRKICDQMIEYDTILFHGSAISVDNEAYIFTATSGTGKSTHTRLWREMLGERAVMVNDDKPLIRISSDGVFVSGTPWDGKHHISSNITVPLKAICILERGSENVITEISAKEALPMLLQQSYHPPKPEARMRFLDLLESLTAQLRFYRLQCNISQEAAETAYEKLHGADE